MQLTHIHVYKYYIYVVNACWFTLVASNLDLYVNSPALWKQVECIIQRRCIQWGLRSQIIGVGKN